MFNMFEDIFGASLENPEIPLSDENVAEYLGGDTLTAAGVRITKQKALKIASVYKCVNVISETIASLPLTVYKRDENGGKQPDFSHPLANILHAQPNSMMTSFAWVEGILWDMLVHGDHFSVIGLTKGGDVLDIIPIDHSSVHVFKVKDRLMYRFKLKSGGYETFDQSRVLHFKGVGGNPLRGESIITNYGVETLGIAQAAQDLQGGQFKNGARLSGILSSKTKLTDPARARLKKAWQDVYSGSGNAFKTPVLEDGLEWKQVSMSNSDAQLLETRVFENREIVSMFRVPPSFVGDHEFSTNSNNTQQDEHFAKHTVRPWLKRIEQELNRKLFPADENGIASENYAKFNLDGLLRGSLTTRIEAYSKAIQNSIMTPGEVRERENLPRKEGDDQLYIQQNMEKFSDMGKDKKDE